MKPRISLITIVLLFIFLQPFPNISVHKPGDILSPQSAYAAADIDDDPIDDDDMDMKKPGSPGRKNPVNYLPDDPEVKKLKLQAMQLAEKFTKILADRTALQPQLAELEKNEAELKHLRLKFQIKYFILRDQLMQKEKKPEIMKLLVRQDMEMMHIEDLIVREEKIDCYHTIFERKHKAMEEYHWSLIDNKHSLIGEYLADMDVKKNKAQFITLYNETIRDYQRIIDDNLEIMKETKEIIEAKKQREVIMKQIVEEEKKLCDELEKTK